MVPQQYILALDYGEKRVGVAIAHVVARLARPLTTLPNDDMLLQSIRQLAGQESAGLIIVGLPRGMDGGYTAQTKVAEAFADRLRAAVTVPVKLSDETLTSVDATQALNGKKYEKTAIDAMAATYILERYLTENFGKGGNISV